MGLISGTVRLLRWLWKNEVGNYRRARWIRRETSRLNPDLFDPDEVPVICLECGYELRGPAEGECPECGTSYDRGKLLVRIYLKNEAVKRSRLQHWGRRLGGAGTGLMVLALAAPGAVYLFVWSFSVDQRMVILEWMDFTQRIVTYGRAILISFVTGYLMMVIGMGVTTFSPAFRTRRRGKPVREWVRQNRPWEDELVG